MNLPSVILRAAGEGAKHVLFHSVSTVLFLIPAVIGVLMAPRRHGVAQTLALSGAFLLAVTAASQTREQLGAFGYGADNASRRVEALVRLHGSAVYVSSPAVLLAGTAVLLIALAGIARAVASLVQRRRLRR